MTSGLKKLDLKTIENGIVPVQVLKGAPSQVQEGLDAVHKLRQVSDAKFNEAKQELAHAFATFASALSQREAALIVELTKAHQAEQDSLSQRDVCDSLREYYISIKFYPQASLRTLNSSFAAAAGDAKESLLLQAEQLRNIARVCYLAVSNTDNTLSCCF